MKITRDVITDLWPLYAAGEASADTRALVEHHLAEDGELARRLRADVALPAAPVELSPDAELAALRRTSALLRGHSWLRALRLLALALTALALRRVFTDTSWVRPISGFLGELGAATVCWTAYALLLGAYRKRSLRAGSG